jgi:mannose-6-phosphate isomerase-like protein (cupin superfamily)
MELKTVKKPWGEEIWFAQTENYAGKVLKVNKGHRLSLQFHRKKTETQFIYKGIAKLTFGKTLETLQEIILNPGDKFDITPPLIHRIEAIEDLEIFEVSTPELDDVVKIEDDYGRTGEGNNFEQDENLHNTNTK